MKKKITFEEVKELVEKLAQELENPCFPDIERIFPVMRGGLIPAALLNRLTGIPIELNPDLCNPQTTLYIDDINDSGLTFERLNQFNTASLFMRSTTKRESFVYGEIIEDDSWIVFPWESEIDEPIQDYLKNE